MLMDGKLDTKHIQMSQDSVKLVGFWSSPLVIRVKWALSLKGIEYEYIEEEDLLKKSSMLLQYNPVHKKVPVFVHNGNPIAESLLIMEYIDEVWKDRPLLPEDPVERARSRFWAKYVDDVCVPMVKRLMRTTQDEKENDAKETREILKTLESSLNPNKPVSGEESLGFMEIAIVWVGIWLQVFEKLLDVKLLDEENTPSLNKWFRDVFEVDVIKKFVPPFEKMLARYTDVRDRNIKARLNV